MKQEEEGEEFAKIFSFVAKRFFFFRKNDSMGERYRPFFTNELLDRDQVNRFENDLY